MMHKKRRWCVGPVENAEALAEKLTQHSWTLCTGFELLGYLFLNDATSEDGAQEYAVVRRPAEPGQPWIQVESVTFGSVRQRLARTLVEFCQQAGADEFTLPVTHQELALRLGTAREVVSRNLSRFQAEELIRIDKRTVVLLDRDGLEREAETEF